MTYTKQQIGLALAMLGAALFDVLAAIYPAPVGAIQLAPGQTYWPAPSRSAVVA